MTTIGYNDYGDYIISFGETKLLFRGSGLIYISYDSYTVTDLGWESV